MLATSDREPFVHRLHAAKQKHLVEMVRSGSIPLRKGMCIAVGISALPVLLTALMLLLQCQEPTAIYVPVVACKEMWQAAGDTDEFDNHRVVNAKFLFILS